MGHMSGKAYTNMLFDQLTFMHNTEKHIKASTILALKMFKPSFL